MTWHEGPNAIPHQDPNKVQDKGPYFSSERLDVYAGYAKTLLENGDAYPCFCSAERLRDLKDVGYDGFCPATYSADQILEKKALGEPYLIRLKVPKGTTLLNDLVQGEIEFENPKYDQVLIKADGYPTYQFANMVDDLSMGITHVIRGEEWLPTTPKQLILFKLFGFKPPLYAHLPNIRNVRNQELSKKFFDKNTIAEYKSQGYLPESVLNTVGLLGWNPPHRDDYSVIAENTMKFVQHEVLTLPQMLHQFNLDKIGRIGAVFD